ncbi:MAG: DUF2933 domain-containing protein [Patescibacteria group bacterium]
MWLIILLCPLMHVFMMKNGHHGRSDNQESGASSGCGHQKSETKNSPYEKGQ